MQLVYSKRPSWLGSSGNWHRCFHSVKEICFEKYKIVFVLVPWLIVKYQLCQPAQSEKIEEFYCKKYCWVVKSFSYYKYIRSKLLEIRDQVTWDCPRGVMVKAMNYIWFGLLWFYGISIIVCYLMPSRLYTYISNIKGLVWFGLVGFYGISTIVGYSMPNHLYTDILNI